MKPLIQNILPDRFLLQFGIYMQTCAHIELCIWHIIQLADRQDPFIGADEGRLKLKKSTRGLMQKFKSACHRCGPEFSDRLTDLYQRVENGQENRNTAAHGAWFTEDGEDGFRVEHYIKRDELWFEIDQPVKWATISEALEDADKILRDAIELRRQLHQSMGFSG